MAEVGALGVVSGHTAKPNLWSVGHQVTGPYGLHDIPDGVQDQLWLLKLDVVAALGDQVPAARDHLGQLALELEPQRLLLLDKGRTGHIRMPPGHDHQRHRPRRRAAQRHPGLAFTGPDVDLFGVDQPMGHGHRLLAHGLPYLGW